MQVTDYIDQHFPRMAYIAKCVAFQFHLDPEEHIQICMEKALTSAYRDAGLKSFFGWWRLLCHGRAIDIYRKNIKIPGMVAEEWAYSLAQERDRLADRHELAMLYLRLRKKFGHRTLMLYMVTQGYSLKEISAHFNMNIETVKGIILRCRKYIK